MANFWSGSMGGVGLQDSAVRYFRKEYERRLAAGEKRTDVEADLTRRIGNSRASVRNMLRGETYQWVSKWSEDELAARGGVE